MINDMYHSALVAAAVVAVVSCDLLCTVPQYDRIIKGQQHEYNVDRAGLSVRSWEELNIGMPKFLSANLSKVTVNNCN